jgi:CDGSH-type Zn-finger protein
LPEIKQYIMSTTKITVNSNGSLKVEGDFVIVDAQGNEYGLQGRTTLGLCRCGLSKNKPFCDGAHNGHLDHQAVAFDLPPKKV